MPSPSGAAVDLVTTPNTGEDPVLADSSDSCDPQTHHADDPQPELARDTGHSRSRLGRLWPSSWMVAKALAIPASALAGVFATVLVPPMWEAHQGRSPDRLEHLMHLETVAALDRDAITKATLLGDIFTEDAVIVDAACGNGHAATVWARRPQQPGVESIAERYANLPQFLSLQHINPEIEWSGQQASDRAWASSETLGVIAATSPKGKPSFIVGHEAWVFRRNDGNWKVASFTYNLCVS